MKPAQTKYHVLARGAILSNGHLLVAHCKGMDNTFLPGGHVEFQEGMRMTLVREIREELNQACIVDQFIGCAEDSYEDGGVYHQEINHVFTAQLPEVQIPANPQSNESHLEFYWIPVEDMVEHNVLPIPVREIIMNWVNKEQGPIWVSTFNDK